MISGRSEVSARLRLDASGLIALGRYSGIRGKDLIAEVGPSLTDPFDFTASPVVVELAGLGSELPAGPDFPACDHDVRVGIPRVLPVERGRRCYAVPLPEIGREVPDKPGLFLGRELPGQGYGHASPGTGVFPGLRVFGLVP